VADPQQWLAARPRVDKAGRLIWARHRKDPNIVGVGFGPRRRNGRYEDTPVCQVYVVRKLPEEQLPPDRVIPRNVDVDGGQVETDVVETGRFYAHDYTGRDRPARTGISIGHKDITAGTLGCLVTDTEDNARLAILSNNHVLANSNDGQTGDQIYQPGPADASKTDANVIGELARHVPIDFTGNANLIDCAIALPRNDCDVIHQVIGGAMLPPIPRQPAVGLLFAGSIFSTLHCNINTVMTILGVELIGGGRVRDEITTLDTMPPGAPVQKTGRTTEYTTGRVTGISGPVLVGYGLGKVALFQNQIVTTPMALGGDSGSLLCRGGSGETVNIIINCPAIGQAENLTGIPFTQEWVSIDYAYKTYFSRSLVGQWLIDTFFENANQQQHAVRAMNLEVTPEDRAFGQALYAQYAGEAKLALFNPDRTDLRVTEQHMVEIQETLARCTKYLREDEAWAADQLFQMARSNTVGKNGREMIALLDDPGLLQRLRELAANMGIVEPHG
jgi:hypothetical protein